jgi:thiol-disulfide isomerase/thioredoxin
MKEVQKGINERTFAVEMSCSLGPGDKMLPLTDIADAKTFDETTIDAESNQGKVLMIDFWATWCPPCQKPMKHNDDMLAKHPEWEGKVRIIGLSIDKEADKVMPHVEKHGYQRVEHFVRAASDCSQVYSVNGVPHIVLVDQNGIIQYKGHPA